MEEDERFWEEVDLEYRSYTDEELLRQVVGEDVWRYGYDNTNVLKD